MLEEIWEDQGSSTHCPTEEVPVAGGFISIKFLTKPASANSDPAQGSSPFQFWYPPDHEP